MEADTTGVLVGLFFGLSIELGYGLILWFSTLKKSNKRVDK